VRPIELLAALAAETQLRALDVDDPELLSTTWPQQSHGVITVSQTSVSIDFQ
jgi:uncharacterized protein YndB with AHSA1/START domain